MNEKWQHERQPNSYAMLVRLALIVVLAAFLGFVYSHENAKDIPVDEIEAQLLEQTELGSMKECNERDLLHFLGLDAAQYDSFIYYKSGAALGVDELLIVKAGESDDLDATKDAVEARIASQEKAFDGYGSSQMKLLGKAVVRTKGNYLFYCVAEDSSKYEEVFYDAVQ